VLIADLCRSWLASEGGLATCGANEDAFAGKPAPTDLCVNKKRPASLRAFYLLLNNQR
jgi:hypothetical protein